jgi:hypothetical protein
MNGNKGWVVYSDGTSPVRLNLPSGSYAVRYINPKSGELTADEAGVKGGSSVELKSPQPGAIVLWVSANQKTVQHATSIQK